MSTHAWLLLAIAVSVLVAVAAYRDFSDSDPLAEEIRSRRAHDARYRREAQRPGEADQQPETPDPRRERVRRRPAGRPDPLVEPSPTLPGLPPGWTLREYVDDGMVRLQIMLIQQSRRNP